MIFFDLDDTLLNNTAEEIAAARNFYDLHRESFQITSDEFVKRWRTTTEHYVHRYIAGEISFIEQRRARLRKIFDGIKALGNDQADAMFETYRSFYESNWQLFSDVRNCLDTLSGIKLGIITNGDALQQKQKLKDLCIIDRFEIVVISGQVGVAKPIVEIFLLACHMAGVDPSECCHVGDDLQADVQGSTAAGMNAIWLNRNGQTGPPGIITISSLQK
jgi:putative hydrolase of the HAD superfamily